MTDATTQRVENVISAGTEIAEVGYAYLDGAFVPLADAKVSITTHALHYGTAVFEGIRAYWNERERRMYAFRLREHYIRMARNCAILCIEPPDVDHACEITLELLRRNAFTTDVYVRPLAYKAARSIKVTLHGLRDAFCVYAFPVGAYLPTGGLRAHVASWRRTPDTSIPARGKLAGSYINTALAVEEASQYGAAEAIFLTEDGHVSEGGGANLFMLRGGALVTPPVTDDILEGITRDTVRTLAAERGIAVVERRIDRSELYVCDEVFFCGTGAQIAPCVSIDGRAVGDGRIGPVARAIAERYVAVARGEDAAHAEWRSEVPR